ncbi:MAG TPA: type II toxin-antitoxin system mRNA interferase toxin, RelE/StbE family [Candidatus Paceibacterota bacterium]
MKVILHHKFKKAYKKLRKNEQKRFKERRNIFLINPLDPILENHALSGKYEGYRSINVGGDLRVIFKLLTPEIALFATVDTHSNLYK